MSHSWKFVQKGGFDQVMIETGSDIANLGELNRKLWATLSCPISGVHFDSKTLELIDEDMDGKIRISEVLDAVKYLKDVLINLDELVSSPEQLMLSNLRAETDAGAKIYEAVTKILIAISKSESNHITLDDVLEAKKLFLDSSFNGDGVITRSSINQEAKNALECFELIVADIGSVTDSNGEVGINAESIDIFSNKLNEFLDGVKSFYELNNSLFDDIAQARLAVELFDEVAPKIANFFVRDALIGYDLNAKVALSPDRDFYSEFINSDMQSMRERLFDMPLAIANGDGQLNLSCGVNPIFVDKMKLFKALWTDRFFGDTQTVDEKQFAKIAEVALSYKELFQNLDVLGLASLDESMASDLADLKAIEYLYSIIEEDKKFEAASLFMGDVEKLLRLHQNFYTLLNNFVVFRDFYAKDQKAIFQLGTLFIDGRSCDLCVKVDDMTKHAELAGLSKTYLLYCECSRDAGKSTMRIAAAVTNGDSDNLMVGRNGVFYDRDGLDWDATVVKIVDFPISVRQAFWLPYKKTASFIKSQIEKISKAKDAAAMQSTQSSIKPPAVLELEGKKDVSLVVQGAVQHTPPPPPPVDVGKFAGIFAAIGLALGAMGTAIASIMSGFLALKFWQMPLVVLGVILAISGPSMLIAWVKLAQRNLGPLLDASGWAINTRAKINVPFGVTLTQMAELPKGSTRMLKDPYEDKDSKKSMALTVVAILFLILISILYEILKA